MKNNDKHVGFYINPNGELKSTTKFTLMTIEQAMQQLEVQNFPMQECDLLLDYQGHFFTQVLDINHIARMDDHPVHRQGIQRTESGFYINHEHGKRLRNEVQFHIEEIREILSKQSFISMYEFNDLQVKFLPEDFNLSYEDAEEKAQMTMGGNGLPIIFRYDGGIDMLTPIGWNKDTSIRFGKAHPIEMYTDKFLKEGALQLSINTMDFDVQLKTNGQGN